MIEVLKVLKVGIFVLQDQYVFVGDGYVIILEVVQGVDVKGLGYDWVSQVGYYFYRLGFE